MRLWPGRRAAATPALVTDDLLIVEDRLRRGVEDVFAVRERQIRGGVIIFRGQFVSDPPRALDLLLARFRPVGYTPFVRRDGEDVVIQAWPLPDPVLRQRIGVNVLLFLLTCISTLFAGLAFSGSPAFDALRASPGIARFFAGAPFAFTIMLILGVHEFGHYFTARYYHAAVSLPYFIPAPPIVGTFGAIIRMKSPARDRNSLFDIAVAGPVAGLLIALGAMTLGLEWSRLGAATPEQMVFGQSLLLRFLVYLRFGAIPEGAMVYTHPVADAAWVGFLVTGLNLFPIGQLDGGRISYALFGRHHRVVGVVTFIGLLAMGVLTGALNWFVWGALILLLIGFQHSPPLDDVTPLSPGRRLLGVACLVLVILLLPPVPFRLE
jgi:membrane-associated protease RseP (regulator of RpoE activity)